jgi:hypothetical protein
MDTKKPKTLKAAAARAADAVTPASEHVARSVKALHAGTASSHQQQTALQWIVREAGGKAHFPYHSTDRDTAFALGRYFVADLIVGLINAELSSLRRDPSAETE